MTWKEDKGWADCCENTVQCPNTMLHWTRQSQTPSLPWPLALIQLICWDLGPQHSTALPTTKNCGWCLVCTTHVRTERPDCARLGMLICPQGDASWWQWQWKVGCGYWLANDIFQGIRCPVAQGVFHLGYNGVLPITVEYYCSLGDDAREQKNHKEKEDLKTTTFILRVHKSNLIQSAPNDRHEGGKVTPSRNYS